MKIKANCNLTEKNNLVIERINAAVNVGVKIKTIAEKSGITYFRMASTVNTKSYRTMTSFTIEEIEKINNVLDDIKQSI